MTKTAPDEADDVACARARLGEEIIPEAILPNRVFVSNWRVFRFFHPDLGYALFLKGVVGLLEADNARVAVVRNETEANLYADPPVTVVTRGTTPDQFEDGIRGIKLCSPELHTLDSHSAIAEHGDWCAFWDGKEEIGVVAFRYESDLGRYQSALDALRAVRLDRVVDERTRLLWLDGITRPWRIALQVNYPLDGRP